MEWGGRQGEERGQKNLEDAQQNLPCGFTDENTDAEQEEHEEHSSMLKVIQVRSVESTIYLKSQMRGVEKLQAHVNEATDNDDVQLHVSETCMRKHCSSSSWWWMPHSTSKTLGIFHIIEDRIQQMPQSNQTKQSSWQHMTLERPHVIPYSLFLLMARESCSPLSLALSVCLCLSQGTC